ncbi:unnamed protein product [Blepharisma stoltei]|uniref:Ubiquitin n=1 Tax=Blepharisma stoltei TaxID=1481888 RepID=A0AAU9KB96_9CILI|nr:unnamed protein product [Blepharisma stoltei]
MTNEKLRHRLLTPNYILRRMINKFKSDLPLKYRKSQIKTKDLARFKKEIMKQAIEINNGRTQTFENALTEDRVRSAILENRIEELSQRILIDVEESSDIIETSKRPSSYSLTFKTSENRWFRLQVESTDSVAELKTKIFNRKCIPEIQQRLIFNGRELFDNEIMSEFNIYDGALILLRLETWSCITENFLITVKNLRGEYYEFEVSSSDSIKSLKQKIQDAEGTPVPSQRLIYAGRQTEDEWSLRDYNIRDGSTIHLVLILRGC